MSRWKVRVRDDPFNFSKEVLILKEQYEGAFEVIRFTYEQHAAYDIVQEPTFTDSLHEREDNLSLFQALVDAAWEHSYRPAGMKDLTETMRMQNNHLQDMREISRHLLEMDKKS